MLKMWWNPKRDSGCNLLYNCKAGVLILFVLQPYKRHVLSIKIENQNLKKNLEVPGSFLIDLTYYSQVLVTLSLLFINGDDENK